MGSELINFKAYCFLFKIQETFDKMSSSSFVIFSLFLVEHLHTDVPVSDHFTGWTFSFVEPLMKLGDAFKKGHAMQAAS